MPCSSENTESGTMRYVTLIGRISSTAQPLLVEHCTKRNADQRIHYACKVRVTDAISV
jgi:hypothetical protein